jgi:small subunit ribosomal protein S5
MARRDQKMGGDGRGRRSDLDQKTLDVRRTARVVAGGRRFSFRATVVVGDRNGRVGLGTGKGPNVADAVDKAVFQAKKAIIRIPLTESKTIPHESGAKFAAARVFLRPARQGRGLVAGGPVRVIADLAGIRDLTAKILGRTVNKLNNANATIEALKKLKNQESLTGQARIKEKKRQAAPLILNSYFLILHHICSCTNSNLIIEAAGPAALGGAASAALTPGAGSRDKRQEPEAKSGRRSAIS